MPGLMEVRVNGENRELEAGATVATLLARHKLAPQVVVIELNQNILRGVDFSTVELKPGDQVEIVHMVAGG